MNRKVRKHVDGRAKGWGIAVPGNADINLEHPDREKCDYGFNKFLEMQEILISSMKDNHVTMKQCFGF